MTIPNAAIGDLFSVTVNSHVNDQLGQMGCGFAVTGITGTSAPYTSVQASFDGNIIMQFQGLNSSTVTLRGTSLEVYDTPTGAVKVSCPIVFNPQMGNSSIPLAPTQVAPVVTKVTGYSGRSGRGRIYWSFPLTGFFTATGELNSSIFAVAVANLTTFFAAATVTVTGGTCSFIPVLIRRRPLPLTYTPIASFVSRGFVGTQRRRGDYGRANP